MEKKINVAVVGLGFGGAFVPIYLHHPNVGKVGLFDTRREKAETFARRYGIGTVYDSYEQILSDDTVDAVHLVTPIPLHEEQTVKALEAGKHCACTVPMGITLGGLRRIVEAVRRSKKKYMMMETSVYTRNFFFAKEMKEKGLFGRIQFLRGAHYQDMENWPDYWLGLPPMYYGTHAIAPLATLAGSKIKRVYCVGSGSMREELRRRYQNPYSIESALFEFENGVKAEATRSLFCTARDYTESFNVYGSKSSFEWQQIEGEDKPIVFQMEKRGDLRGTPVFYRRVTPPDHADLLPESIRKYTVRGKYFDETNPQITFEEGGGHGGSHPHLVNEFIRSIVEDRRPRIDEITAANITAAGICAHESALRGGVNIELPDFETPK